MLYSQLIELSKKLFSCQHPAPNDGVGTVLPEATQPAIAHQGVPRLPTQCSSKTPTLDLFRLRLERAWVAWGMATASARYTGVCMSIIAAAARWPMGWVALVRESLAGMQTVRKGGGQFAASTFKMTVTKTLPQLSWLGIDALSLPNVKQY